MKITVIHRIQHDGVDVSEGRHDVTDQVGKQLIDSGSAEEGWTHEDGPLSQAGTQSPPGRLDGSSGTGGAASSSTGASSSPSPAPAPSSSRSKS